MSLVCALLCGGALAQGNSNPETQLQEAQQLHIDSDKLYQLGKYADAIPLSRRALEIREKLLGPEHVDTAASIVSLGRLYKAMGRFAVAETYYKRGLAIREKVLGEDHVETAKVLNNLGNLYTSTGHYLQAAATFRRSLAILEKVVGPDHENTAKVLNNLAAVYVDLNELNKAEELYKRALSIAQKTTGIKTTDAVAALDNLANLYTLTGAFTRAEPLYVQAIAIREEILPPTNPDSAISISNLAEMYFRIGRFAEAESLHRRALETYERSVGLNHPTTAQCLSDLANVLLSEEKFAESESLYLRATAIREKLLGPSHATTAITLFNLATLYRSTGEFKKSEQLYNRAINIFQTQLSDGHDHTSAALAGLASLYMATGRLSAALPLLQKAQSNLARSSTRFMVSNSEARSESYIDTLIHHAHREITYSTLARSQQSLELGLIGALQYKGRTLDAKSNSVSRMRNSLNEQESALFDEFADVASQISMLMYQDSVTSTQEERKKLVNELEIRQEKLEDELAQKSGEFRQQFEEVNIARLRRSLPPNSALIELFRYIRFDPRAVDPEKGHERYVAYLLPKDGALDAVDLGDAETVDAMIRDLLASIANPTTKSFRQHSAAMYSRLIEPLFARIKNISHLFISPDGEFNLVPLGALLDENGQYLLEQYQISVLTTARDLLRLGGRFSPKSTISVIADPDFGPMNRVSDNNPRNPKNRSIDLDRSGIVFRRLESTEQEARELVKLFDSNQPELILHAAATEARIKEIHAPQILHVATHGFFLGERELPVASSDQIEEKLLTNFIRENPLLRSGVALAGANSRQSGANEDGILTALEAAQLDLHGTELVVLSACDTGIGEVKNGEGVYGLRRALVLAGAETQVTSLWKVSDEATRILMVNFYQRLLQGQGRSEALRHAQLDMLATPEHSHPYYWASFIPIGNWKPLSKLH